MESPDCEFVYFAKDESCRSLWRIPVAGGEEAHVLDIQGSWSWKATPFITSRAC